MYNKNVSFTKRIKRTKSEIKFKCADTLYTYGLTYHEVGLSTHILILCSHAMFCMSMSTFRGMTFDPKETKFSPCFFPHLFLMQCNAKKNCFTHRIHVKTFGHEKK